MTKRITAIVLVLALLVSVMPNVTFGVSAVGSSAPGASELCDHTSHEGWTEWTDTTKLPTEAGKYYLDTDVNLTDRWAAPAGETHLCLNGNTIKQTAAARVINVGATANLSIYDCATAYNADGEYVGGVITGGNNSTGSGVWVSRGGGVFNLYGGRITGNTHATGANGGAVYLQSSQTDKNGGVFNMYGGEIHANGTAKVTVGPAVYLHGENLTNRCEPATFNMYGGTISENKGKQGGAASGIYDAVINIQGGKLIDNEVSGSGGAIYSEDDMVVTVANTTITGNKAANASAIYGQNSVQITVKDTTITGNEATSTDERGFCAAIHLTGAASKLTLSGEVTIKDNTMALETVPDVLLRSTATDYSNEKLNVNEMTGGYVRFSVLNTLANVDEASDVVVLNGTQNAAFQTGSITFVNAEGEEKAVGYVDGAFTFVDGHFHEGVEYTAWTDGSKLPSSGTYYLDTNVTVTAQANRATVTGGNSLHLCMNGHTVGGNNAYGEMIRVENGNLYISDCTTVYDEDGYFVSGGKFENCKRKGNGAAIYANNAASVIEIVGVEFSGNTSTETTSGYGGGAVQFRKNNTAAKLIGCKFSNNTSSGDGGALALREGGTAYIEKTIFTENHADGAGGAIYVYESKLTLKDCLFEENSATSGGGAICTATDTKKTTTSAVVMEGCTFKKNQAANAGAVNIGGVSNVTIKNTTITENHADGAGGAIYATGGVLTIENSKINDNEAVGSGAIYSTGCKVTIKNSQINDNDGKTSTSGAMTVTGASVLNMTNTEMKGNTAKTVSVMNILGNNTQVTLTDVTITGNESTGATYGAVNLANGSAVVKLVGKTTIYDNLNNADAQQNLHLQAGATYDYDVSGLTDGAKVGVSLLKARIDAGDQMFFSTTGMTTNPGYCVSDDDAYKVELDAQGRLALVENTGGEEPTPPVTEGHTHKLCNDASCTSHGDAVPFEKWTDATTLPTSGNYYLDVDVELTSVAAPTGDLNLCLNGHTVKQTTAGSRVMNVEKGVTVSITDCGTNGTITGGTGTYGAAISVRRLSTFNLYGGKISGNIRTNNIGAEGTVYIQAPTATEVGGIFNMYGGEISDNEVIRGGGVSLASGTNAGPATFNMYGGVIKDNEAVTYITKDSEGKDVINGGYGGAIQANGVAKINIEGGEITGNEAVRNGGAIYVGGASEVTIADAQITGNEAVNEGGAIYSDKGGKITVTNTEIKNNTGKNGSGITAFGGSLTLDGAKIEGNNATNSYGAVHLNNKSGVANMVFTVKGATTITGNTAKDTTAQNLFMRNSATFVTVDGLTDGAKIGVTMEGSRLNNEARLYITSNTVSETVKGYFESDDDSYEVVLKDDKAALAEKAIVTDHMHNVCNDTACTEHGIVPFVKWEKTDSLPSSGNYYLDVDVELTAATTVSGELNLCLNGHTIKQTKAGQRVISVSQDSVLTITDCKAAPGSITGGNNDFGSAIYLNEGADFNLFGGRITGNTPASENSSNTGAAIFLRSASKGGATFNMYGGEISGNGNDYSWGGAVSNGLGNAGKTVYVNIYGGKITGNTAGTGGAIRLSNGAVLTIVGGEITDNTAETGGAVYLVNGAELKLEGGKISGNSAGLAGGIYTTAANTVTVSGDAVVIDNTANGKKNNLYLDGDAVITLGAVTADAKVGISVSKVDRAISTESDTDYSKYFVGDSAYKSVSYRNKVLYVEGSKDHQHCVCDSTVSACDHSKQVWTAWESTTSLPTSSGYYYLTENVTMSTAVTTGTDQEIYLCLNGKTVTTAKRHLIISKGTEYSITDCNAAPGGLTGAKNTYGGSMNVNSGATLNLFAGKIYGNTAPESEGGAIYLQAGQVKSNEELPGGVFNMYGGEISGNSAKYGAGIRAAGTNVDGIAPAQINIYGGVISGNKAVATVTVNATTGKETKSGGNGGAIAATNSTVINLLGGTITGNTSDGDGAGIYANAKTQLTIKDAKLTDNVAGGYGGAIFATSNGTVITMESGEMSGNVSNAGGAVMTQTRSKFVLNGGKISGNTDLKSGGGGLYISTNTEFVMNGGEISGNKATGNGGGFYALRSKVTLNGGVISGNEAKNRAGGVMLSGAEAVFNKITIKDNSANEGGAAYINRTSATSNGVTTYYPSTVTINDGAVITGNKATTNCGGILMANEGTVVTMVGGEITKNTAKNGGGLMTWSQSRFVLKGGKINNNTATSGGGGLYISTNTFFDMEGGTVAYNTALNGGGIYFLRSTGTLSGGSITSNSAKAKVTINATTGAETKSGGSAGGIYVSGTKLDMKGTYITNNKADSNGGGIVMGRASYKENGVTKYALVKVNIYSGVVSGNYSGASAGGMLMQSEGTVVNMYGGTFTKNTSAKSGGGIYVSTKTTFNMTGGRVVENHAETTGGGIFAYKSTANISGGELNSNTSVTNGANLVASGGTVVVTLQNMKLYGGVAKTAGCLVVQTQGSILNLENCEIYDNQSTSGHGGAVFVSNKAFGNFTNCKFFDNQSANLGGAVLVNNFANATFTGCEFYENSAAKQGGALWTSVASNTTVEDCTFHKNVAGTRGGAITCKGNMLLKNSIVENNTAAEDGGGIYTDTNTTTGSGIMEGMVIENSKIQNNTATLQGGGLFIHKGCRVEIYGTEITGNKSGAEGGAIWAYEDLELHDTTVTGNTSGGEGFAVYMNDANFDGHSYFTSRNKLSGNVIIKDNENGNLYMGKDVVFAITADGLGTDTHIELALDSGILTSRILGAYNYEGGSQVYTVTYGDRSLTDPEVAPVSEEVEPTQGTEGTEGTQATEPANDNTVLYAGVGAFAVVIAAVAVIVIMAARKKKKAEESAAETTQE